MKRLSKHKVLVLLLVVVLSQLNLTLHAADHIVEGSKSTCQLGHGRDDLDVAIPVASAVPPVIVFTADLPSFEPAVSFDRFVTPYTARAPPTIS